MAAPALQGLFNKKKEEPYFGKIELLNRTLCFSDMIILRQNISYIEKYVVEKNHKVSTPLLVLSIAVVIATFFFLPMGLIFTFLFAIPIVIGIMERLKPQLNGLSVNLNSGYTHTFLSKDNQGITQLFTKMLNALDNGDSLTADFSKGNIEINYMQMTINGSNNNVAFAGRDATNNVTGNVTNKLQTLNEQLKNVGISATDIAELNNILESDNAIPSQKRLGDKSSKWIRKIVTSGVAVAEGVLTGFITNYYGW